MHCYKTTMTLRTQERPITVYSDSQAEATLAEYQMTATWQHIITSIETVPVTGAEAQLYCS